MTEATTPVPVKLCRDCYYSRNKYFREEDWQCASPLNNYEDKRISLVTGDFERPYSAMEARHQLSTGCGFFGLWFLSTKDAIHKHFPSLTSTSLLSSLTKKINLNDI